MLVVFSTVLGSKVQNLDSSPYSKNLGLLPSRLTFVAILYLHEEDDWCWWMWCCLCIDLFLTAPL